MRNFCCLTIFFLFVILTSMLALSSHVLILRYCNMPTLYIDSSLKQQLGFVIQFLTVFATVLIYFWSKLFWDKITFLLKVILFAVLIMALKEQLFRSVIMNIVVGVPWAYQLLSTIPSYINFLSISILVCLFMRITYSQKQFSILQLIFVIVIITAVSLLIKKITNFFIAPLLTLVTPIDLLTLINPPYGKNVMIPAYITFLEPTIASFVLFYLIEKQISFFSVLIKGLFLGSILILIHGEIYSILQMVYSEGNIFYRIFYFGQFMWEYLILGLLTVYTFDFMKNTYLNIK